MSEDLHGTQEREVLRVRQLLCDGGQVDRVRERGQPGLHLEPPEQGDRPEVVRPHGRRPVHRLPPHREYHRIRKFRE